MLPNLITGLRLAVLPPLFICLSDGSDPARWTALGLFLFAGITDVFDGWLARRLQLTSPFGAFLDLLADRLLTLTVVCGLIAGGLLSGIWAAAGLLLVARDFLVAGLNEGFGDLGIKTGSAEKAKVALQFLGLGLLAAPQLAVAQVDVGNLALAVSAVLATMLGLSYLTTALRVVRGA